ncbi:MAG: Permease of the drug/metabolite transporter superfamily [Labilithrix sp.]|nr:Permease of the drug/metabolite transporter superfamily [Labilithrix sp.]
MPADGATAPRTTISTREKVLIGGALLAVYVVWGSTYFAMRVALQVFPPFLMAGPRFVAAGLLLFAILRWRGAPMPTGKQWVSAGVIGILLLVLGNGLVAVAQRTVDSGVAATVVATMPLWVAGIGTAWGERPSLREVVGLLVGFAGVAVLQRGGSLSFGSIDSIAILFAPVAWAFGSLLSRRIPVPPGPMASAAQMIVGGFVMIGIALLRGERPLGPPTASSVGALLYLVFFGSLLAFSAYGYLLRTTRPSIATSYAYVNPLVALALGALLGGEPFTGAKVVACLLTIGGVVIVSAPWRRART